MNFSGISTRRKFIEKASASIGSSLFAFTTPAFSSGFAYKGIKGETSQGKMNLAEVNQQAMQMDDFASCVLVPGEMGLRDVKILMAIYEAARTGRKVQLTNL